MKFLSIFSIITAVITTTKAITPITVKNNALYVGNTDERFYIRGVDYQPGGSSNLTDPLSDPEICKRDIPYFKDLGLNTIRVYSVDNTLNHTECMSELEAAGIYVILDVNTPKTSISRHDPACSYNLQYLTEIFATIDSFAAFDNTLGFFSANELINDVSSFQFSPYVKAVTRDMKQYMRAQNYRAIPVGYSAADVSEVRLELAHYLNCGDVDDERIDMLGVNDYSWCGHASFISSGYKGKVADYSGYSIPIFLSEFGCNKVVDNRPFTEIQVIYSNLMSPVFSGGLVYEYFEYINHYGLVEADNSTGAISELTDYDNLKNMLASTQNPSGDGGAASYNYSECPTDLNFSITVPDQPEGLTQLMKDGPKGENYGFDAETQDACYDDDEDDVASSSSSEESFTTSSSSFASSSSSSSSYFSTSTTSSSSASTTFSASSAEPTSSTVSSIASAPHSKNNADSMNKSFGSLMAIITLISSIFLI